MSADVTAEYFWRPSSRTVVADMFSGDAIEHGGSHKFVRTAFLLSLKIWAPGTRCFPNKRRSLIQNKRAVQGDLVQRCVCFFSKKRLCLKKYTCPESTSSHAVAVRATFA